MTDRNIIASEANFAARLWIAGSSMETIGQVGCLVRIIPRVVRSIYELRPEVDTDDTGQSLPLHGCWGTAWGVTVQACGLAMVLGTAGMDAVGVGVMTRMQDGRIFLFDEAYREMAEAWRLQVGYYGPWPLLPLSSRVWRPTVV